MEYGTDKAEMGVGHVETILNEISKPLGCGTFKITENNLDSEKLAKAIINDCISKTNMLDVLKYYPKPKNIIIRKRTETIKRSTESVVKKEMGIPQTPHQKFFPNGCDPKCIALATAAVESTINSKLSKSPRKNSTNEGCLKNVVTKANRKSLMRSKIKSSDSSFDKNQFITLTLEPVPNTSDCGTVKDGWKYQNSSVSSKISRPGYYVNTQAEKNMQPFSSHLNSHNSLKNWRSASQHCQSGYLQKQPHMNLSHAASATLEAFAAMRKVLTSSKDGMTKTGLLPLKHNSQTSNGNNHRAIKEKSRCSGVSDHYVKYLNKPKGASHDALKVVFKAAIPLSDKIPPADVVNEPQITRSSSWSSGKEPLPGYKGCKRHLDMEETVIPNKRRRIVSFYRVPKPKVKPKSDSLILQKFPGNLLRKPVWVQPARRKPMGQSKFVPLDKLKWNPLTKKFVIPKQQSTCKSVQNKQWFTFPSTKPKCNNIQNHHFRRKITTISTPHAVPKLQKITSVPGMSLLAMQKNMMSKAPQNIKEVKMIFKCMAAPSPSNFKTYKDYVRVSILYQVRKVMAAKALRNSFLEGKHTKMKKRDGGENKNTVNQHTPTKEDQKCNVMSSQVLISCQTEFALSSWSSKLPFANTLDNTLSNLPTVSSDWLYLCSGNVVQFPPPKIFPPSCNDSAEEILYAQAANAWLYDTLDSPVVPHNQSSLSITKHTGGPSFTAPNIASPLAVDFSSSCKSPRRFSIGKSIISPQQHDEQYPKMQRSMSKAKILNREDGNALKKSSHVPPPSYCVRFRENFCTMDCSCESVNLKQFAKETSVYTGSNYVPFSNHYMRDTKNGKCFKETPTTISEKYFENCNIETDFSLIESDSRLLSKWDMKQSIYCKSRSHTAPSMPRRSWSGQLVFRSNQLNHRLNGCHRRVDDIEFVRKIGNTEIYHHCGVRRLSTPETESNVDFNNFCSFRPNRTFGKTEIIYRKGMKGVKTEVSFPRAKRYFPTVEDSTHTKEWIPFISDCDINGKMRSRKLFNIRKLSCLQADKVKFRHCLYSYTKYQLSAMVKSLTSSAKHFPLCATANERNTSPSSLTDTSENTNDIPLILHNDSENVGDTSTRKVNNASSPFNTNLESSSPFLIGSTGGLDCQNAKTTQAEHSLTESVQSNALVLKNVPATSFIHDKEMGNKLYKPNLLLDIASAIAPEFTERQLFNAGSGTLSLDKAKAKNEVVMGVESNVKRDLAFDLPDVSEDLMLEETDFDSQKSNPEIQQECQPMDISEDISSILPEEIYLEDTIDTTVGAEPDIKLDTDDIVNTAIYDKNNRSFLPTHETNVGNHTSESKDFNSIRFEATNKNKETNDQIKTGSNKIVPKKPELNAETQQVALGDQLNDSPVETRSSHRLRSRIGKKRGRYESDDYVVDIPKPTKKPKRVLPTRNYDNDNFWQFYRDAEKTIHARNLVLQNRYIKLFKAKDVNCKVLPQFAGLQSQFTDVVCPSAYAPKTESEPVVPDTGIPAFLTRYTKSRKNSPELPKVEDGNCPYCGRSFAEQPKEVLDSHMARHNMRYTILSAPVLSKKKKKSKTARKDSVLRKPKPGNSAPTTVVVVDPLAPADGKTTSSGSVKNATILNESLSTPLEQLRDALPMAKPSNISMGHRKQTARKSFNIASTLPKDKLIAALACKMRLPSTQNETPTSAIANHQTPNSCATSTRKKSVDTKATPKSPRNKQPSTPSKKRISPVSQRDFVSYPYEKSPIKEVIGLTKYAKCLPDSSAIS